MSKKLVIITGGSQGIGRALSEQLITEDCNVCSCGRSEIKDKLSFDYEILDIRNYIQIEKWAKKIIEKYGEPDLLINNAAIINPLELLESIPSEDIKDLIDINVTGTILVTKAFLPFMKKKKKGGIIGISSYWGREGASQVVPYCTSKFAVEGFSQALSEELLSPMFSVSVNPGIIDTKMLELCFGESSKDYPNAKTWAKVAAPFFLSLNRNHNGESLTVTGF